MKNKAMTTVILSSMAVGVLHLSNRFITATSTVRGLLNKHNGNYYTWRFGNIYYTKSGSGTPLLLLHDTNPCSSSYEWSQLVRKLSVRHTVYTLDLLGCGRSDKPNITYTNFIYVQLISDFIKNVIGGKTDVAATGLTGSYIIMACHNTPELFNKIMLINPEDPCFLSCAPGNHSRIRKFILELPIIGTTVYHLLTRKENVEYLFSEKYFYNPFYLNSKYSDFFYESAHLGGSGGKYLLASMNGLYLNININKALSEINNSIFITAGKHCENIDRILKNYCELNPAIEAEIISNAKYLPQLEVPEELYEKMNIFF